jgi:hypothetical protein
MTEKYEAGQVSRSAYEAAKKAVARQMAPNRHDTEETDEETNSRWILTCLRLEHLPGWEGDPPSEIRQMSAEELVEELKKRGLDMPTMEQQVQTESRSVMNRRFMVDSLRCLFGNPFQTQKTEPAWIKSNHGAALQIARKIQSERRFEEMKALGEALKLGGCANSVILDHCLESGLHVPGCWVIDKLLDKEP